MKDLNKEKCVSSETTKNLSKIGITKPSVELSDFYEFLDPKIVKKIKETSKESLDRISDNIKQYEYELEGAKNILDSLD